MTDFVWFRKRGYLHFDSPVSFDKAKEIVENPLCVARWNFFPFIHMTVKSKKIVNINGKKEKKEKEREINYAAHVDSHIYSYYSKLLNIEYEKKLSNQHIDKNVICFRKITEANGDGQCNIHFAKKVFSDIERMTPCSVLCFDVKGFFDNLDHNILKKMWNHILNTEKLPEDHYAVFKSLIKYSYVEKKLIFKRFNLTKSILKKKDRICSIKDFRDVVRGENLICKYDKKFGIPQGTPISGILSNMYMLNFDSSLKEITDKYNAVFYRYCDDIILVCKKNDDIFFKNIINALIFKLNLGINSKKTMICHFEKNDKIYCDKPVQYLGFMYDGQRTYIRSSSYIKFLNKMYRGVSLAKQTALSRNKTRIYKKILIRPIYKKKLYSRYSYLGKRNFITYAIRSSIIMNDNTIRKQIKPLWKRLCVRIRNAENENTKRLNVRK